MPLSAWAVIHLADNPRSLSTNDVQQEHPRDQQWIDCATVDPGVSEVIHVAVLCSAMQSTMKVEKG